ncbi:MAG: hypothetical protein GY849_12810 [Deltaproteobacteria bacterium]|nr:hypothetical protein [Deltaproteobacteria bacterium]
MAEQLDISDQGELLTASVDDYLLSLADSLHQAQKQLSRMKLPAQPGQPAITYQIPRLDFELKMSFEVTKRGEKETAASGGSGTGVTLRARPVGQQQAGAQTTTAEAASIIKGSFVAVPAEGGKPPSVIKTSLERISSRLLKINVDVKSAAGENLSGIQVQFNLDRDLSRTLNKAQGLDIQLQADTDLWDGMVPTDADGNAVTNLHVDPEEPVNAYVAVIVDVLGETEKIVFKVEA